MPDREQGQPAQEDAEDDSRPDAAEAAAAGQIISRSDVRPTVCLDTTRRAIGRRGSCCVSGPHTAMTPTAYLPDPGHADRR